MRRTQIRHCGQASESRSRLRSRSRPRSRSRSRRGGRSRGHRKTKRRKTKRRKALYNSHLAIDDGEPSLEELLRHVDGPHERELGLDSKREQEQRAKEQELQHRRLATVHDAGDGAAVPGGSRRVRGTMMTIIMRSGAKKYTARHTLPPPHRALKRRAPPTLQSRWSAFTTIPLVQSRWSAFATTTATTHAQRSSTREFACNVPHQHQHETHWSLESRRTCTVRPSSCSFAKSVATSPNGCASLPNFAVSGVSTAAMRTCSVRSESGALFLPGLA